MWEPEKGMLLNFAISVNVEYLTMNNEETLNFRRKKTSNRWVL